MSETKMSETILSEINEKCLKLTAGKTMSWRESFNFICSWISIKQAKGRPNIVLEFFRNSLLQLRALLELVLEVVMLEVALEVAPARKSCSHFMRHHDCHNRCSFFISMKAPATNHNRNVFYSQWGSSSLLNTAVDVHVIAILVQQSHVKSCVCSDHQQIIKIGR